MTGYYLLISDLIWRSHSWCLERASGWIIETTEIPLAYYGFELSSREAMLMFVGQCGIDERDFEGRPKMKKLLAEVIAETLADEPEAEDGTA